MKLCVDLIQWMNSRCWCCPAAEGHWHRPPWRSTCRRDDGEVSPSSEASGTFHLCLCSSAPPSSQRKQKHHVSCCVSCSLHPEGSTALLLLLTQPAAGELFSSEALLSVHQLHRVLMGGALVCPGGGQSSQPPRTLSIHALFMDYKLFILKSYKIT